MKSGREVMKGEMEGKWKIAGVTIAVMLVISVLAATVPMVSARPTANQIDSGDTVYIGEQGLNFDLGGDGDYGDDVANDGSPVDVVVDDGDDAGTLEGVPDTPTEGASPITVSAGMTIPETTEGKYYADTDGVPGWSAGDFYVFIDHAEITADVILNNADQDSVEGKSVPTSSKIVFKIEPNFGGKIPGAQVKISLKDPDGIDVLEIDGQSLRNLLALGTTFYVMGPDGDPDADNPATPAVDESRDGISLTPPPYTDALDLTDMDTGEYTFRVKTVKASCNLLDIESSEYSFTVRSEELEIEAIDKTVSKGEDMSVKITADPNEWYYLIVTGVKRVAPGEPSEVPEIKMAGDVKMRDDVLGDAAGDAYPATASSKGETNLAAWVQTGDDGIAEVKISTTGADDRTYTVKVYRNPVTVGPDGRAGTADDAPLAVGNYAPDSEIDPATPEDDEDHVDITVEEARVTFDIPRSAIIGEEITIRGTISAGDRVDIVIDDILMFADEPVDENKEFEVDWDTSGYTVGSYTIEVYIDRDDLDNDGIPDVDEVGNRIEPIYDEDGKTSIRLVVPELEVEQERNLVAEDDDYEIEGTATGVDDVDLVLIGPDGYNGQGLDVLNGLYITSISVTEEDEFSEEITMSDGVDTGMWIAMVFSPGRDGTYGDLEWPPGNPLEAGELADVVNVLNLAGKDQNQIVDMLLDHTVNVAGSDDLCKQFTFKVESAYVRLNPVETVSVGQPLNVSGTTNREPGTIITVSTFSGPTELPAEMVEVEWPTKDIGVFNLTIDTSEAVPGTYILEADDGDGHTDTVTVEIKAAVPSPTPSPSPTVSPTPTPTPTPSPSPTPPVSPVAPTTPTPTPSPSPSPTPGFEAIFAVAGLLAVTYFVLHRKK